MLGSLTRDLQELGITAAPAGLCAACRKPIAGKVSPRRQPGTPGHPPGAVLTALGKTWHPEHFTCARCGQELDKGPFFEQGGQAFCEEDYHQAFSPRCAYCAGPIREKVLTALEQTWHPEHFFCAHCGKLEGRPYCELHFHQRQGTICHGCSRPVTGRCITAAGRRYHPEHFVCTYCLGRLHKGTFRECDIPGICPLDLKQ
uniref:Uncharacterized protein n=1 Tax=Corvus moneduloides TaxID=1196302 RepID=A0A8U7MEQ2_CORMO